MNWEEYYNEGIALKEEGDFEKSAEYHLKVLEIKPDISIPEVWHNTGAALLRLNKSEEAKPYLEKALGLYDFAMQSFDDKRAYYTYWKAAVYSLLDNKEAMLAILEECFEIDDSYAREVLYEEDFSKFVDDKEFQNLIEPIVKAIDLLLYRGESMAKSEATAEQLSIREDFINILTNEGWNKDSFFTDLFDEMSVSPQACFEYWENPTFNFRLGLHLDTKLIFWEIYNRHDSTDIQQFRLYYDEIEMKEQMPTTLQVISEYKDTLTADNIVELIKKLIPLCRLQIQNLDGTRINIG